MHDRQYRDYKSGVAKKRFEEELQHAKDAAMAKNGYSEEEIKKLKRAKADPVIAPDNGQVLWEVSVEGPSIAPFIGRKYQHDEVFCYLSTPWGEYEKILTGFTGRILTFRSHSGKVNEICDVAEAYKELMQPDFFRNPTPDQFDTYLAKIASTEKFNCLNPFCISHLIVFPTLDILIACFIG
jgi:hypothetical protein